jgi:hypothetical protein
MSSPGRMLGPWDRVPVEVCLSVCVYVVCNVLRVDRGIGTPDPLPKVSECMNKKLTKL